jgi:tRNA (Thr-GGU) A37 N-methylase
MMRQLQFCPIGTVHSPVKELVDDVWGGVKFAIDGTPGLSIKPYMQEFAARGRHANRNGFNELMGGYWKTAE